MAITAWFNIGVASAGGKHSLATTSGDQNSGDICVGFDPVKVPTTMPLADIMQIIRTGWMSRGYK